MTGLPTKVLKPETARAILYGNAERIWFEGWDVPTVEKDGPRYAVMPPTMHVRRYIYFFRAEVG